MLFYCLRCHERTHPVNGTQKIVFSKAGRYRVAEVCTQCGKKKSSFISAETYKNLGSPPVEPYSEPVKRSRKSRKKKTD